MFDSVVSAIFYHAEKTPDKLCLADDFGEVTYKEYSQKILRFASCFQSRGVKKGDKVVIEACQTVDYLAMTHAIQILGGVFVPVEHNCAKEKIQKFSDRVQAKMIVAEKTDSMKNAVSYSELTDMYGESEIIDTFELPEKSSVSEILFSTGTTGREKGIVVTHANDIAIAENVIFGVEMEKDNVEMIPSPLNHSHGLRRYYANMCNGSTVVLLSSVMNIMKFFANIDHYQVNSIDLVPTALSVVLKLSRGKLADYADRIRYIQLGAAPLMEHDKEAVCALLPHTRLYNFYGSTESGCTCIYNFNVPNDKLHCIGKPTHNTEVIFVDDDRNPIVPSEENTGLIATKGKMNVSEYYEDPEETAKAMADGIVYSNDIGYLDSDGDIILLGRKGDVINVGGNKVSPEEIENAAKEMDIIVDCGCIPVADAAKGNVPKLFVQLKKGVEFEPIEIRKFLASKLEPYKVPTYIEQVDKIPRSYNGKLLRKELK